VRTFASGSSGAAASPSALTFRPLRRFRGFVADPVRERCADIAPGVPSFGSAAELIDAGAADLLVLATPAGSHLADARLAAAAGLPTLIEKPPARTLVEAEELARLEPAPRLAFNRRFVPELQKLRAALRAASRVELTLAMSTRASSWRAHEVADDALDNLGSHLVDLARWLSGADIENVVGDVAPQHARLELELADGRGAALVECATNRPYRERVSAGRYGSYAAGGAAAAVKAVLGRSPHTLVDSFAWQLQAFVHGDGEHLATAADGVAVMATLEAARRPG
jgi:predicted dehydrogenase